MILAAFCLLLQTVEIVMQTEQRYLEVTTLGRKMLRKALTKYGPSVKCLSGTIELNLTYSLFSFSLLAVGGPTLFLVSSLPPIKSMMFLRFLWTHRTALASKK